MSDQPLGSPSQQVLGRLHEGAALYADFKRLLHEHREGALECHDHPEFYCCVCGEHMALGYTSHLAAVLAKREKALLASGLLRTEAEVVAEVVERVEAVLTSPAFPCEWGCEIDIRAALDGGDPR